MMAKRLFRQEHPVLTGFFILGVIFLVFWGGITFFIVASTKSSRDDLFGQKEGIGIIEIKGVIVTSEEVIADLCDFRNNEKVKAIVLRIDSPGGAVGASQEIYEEVKRTNRLKPVIASMGSVAASGGYYAALGAERIMASPGTMTGSMGVIIKFANLKEFFDKVGYKSEVVKSGNLKDIGSLSRSLTAEEQALLQNLIDNVHAQFVRAIVESRKLSEEKVKAMADGRIFSGEQAKNAGLIDSFGNFMDAIIAAAERVGLNTEQPNLIYPKEKRLSLTQLLAEESSGLFGKFSSMFPILSYELQL